MRKGGKENAEGKIKIKGNKRSRNRKQGELYNISSYKTQQSTNNINNTQR